MALMLVKCAFFGNALEEWAELRGWCLVAIRCRRDWTLAGDAWLRVRFVVVADDRRVMRVVIGDAAAEEGTEGVVVGLRGGRAGELFDLADGPVGQEAGAGAEDFGVVGGDDVLAGEEHLLVELLARPHPGELDLDVGPDLEAGEADEVRGQVDDFDRLPHVQDEDFAAPPQGARLEDELDRLRDGHEEAAHFGVGDRYGAARANLAHEGRDDTAPAPENVSKANGDEFPVVFGGGVLDDLFGQPFGGPHDAGGADGFVGGDEDEVLDVGRHGGVGDVTGANDVVGDGLDDVVLHEGDVLVGGGVEDGVGAEVGEDVEDALPVADVRDDGDEGDVAEVAAELLEDLEDGVLAMAE